MQHALRGELDLIPVFFSVLWFSSYQYLFPANFIWLWSRVQRSHTLISGSFDGHELSPQHIHHEDWDKSLSWKREFLVESALKNSFEFIAVSISFTEAEPSQPQEDEDGGKEQEGNEEETIDESNEPKEEDGEEAVAEKTSKPVTEELPIDANHPDVVQIVNEVMAEAEKREPELSSDEYTDVIEEAIQQRYAELQKMNPDGPQ